MCCTGHRMLFLLKAEIEAMLPVNLESSCVIRVLGLPLQVATTSLLP